MLCRVALVRNDVPDELSASLVWVTGICELGTTHDVTSIRRTLQRNTICGNDMCRRVLSSTLL
jgi:hypothetical protein